MVNISVKYTDEYRQQTADYIISTGANYRSLQGVRIEFKDREQMGDYQEARAGRRCHELEMENAFLKKAAASFTKEQT